MLWFHPLLGWLGCAKAPSWRSSHLLRWAGASPDLLVQLRPATSVGTISQPEDTRASLETLVGLELHVQVDSKAKLFSTSPAAVGAQPNSQVSIFDAALPGTLPVLNRGCVEAAVRTGIALGGTINLTSSFDRKHYFYPDLPHGFQITQLREPIVSGGSLDVPVGKDAVKSVGIQRIQLEVDTGKTLHDLDAHDSCIDLNRAGCALMEVVTGPDMRSGEEAASFVRTFQQLLRHIGTSDGNMEDGSLRVDVNVSVRAGDRSSSRVEVKNLNSIRSVARAVEHEAARHAEALQTGQDIGPETRGFDAKTGKTVLLRGKEGKLDYRFMVEPDLPPVVLSLAELELLAKTVPELPEAVAARLQLRLGLPAAQAKHFTREAAQRRLLEAIMSTPLGPQLNGRSAANMVQGDILRCAKEAKLSFDNLPAAASPERLAELMAMLEDGKVSRGLVKPVLEALVGGDDRDLEVLLKDLAGSSDGILDDREELEELCRQILRDQSEEVSEYCNGNARKMMSFVGALMKQTKGRADPKLATEVFKQLINGGSGGM